MTPKDHKRIEDALKVLEDEGRKSFNDTDGANRWDCIGIAIASVSDNVSGILRLAYSFLEDWNAHDLCVLLEWVRPMYDQDFYAADIARLSSVMNKRGIKINGREGLYNVKILLEEVTGEAD